MAKQPNPMTNVIVPAARINRSNLLDVGGLSHFLMLTEERKDNRLTIKRLRLQLVVV